jgi:hypothetical protein
MIFLGILFSIIYAKASWCHQCIMIFTHVQVIWIHVHPSYNGTSTIGDIAVLILSSSVQVTAIVRPVCLWGQDDSNPIDIVNKEGLVRFDFLSKAA